MKLQPNKHPPQKRRVFSFMTGKFQKIVIFANGELPEPKEIAKRIHKDDFLIAADGGLNHMTALGLRPNLIIGDMDSVDKEKLEFYRTQNISIKKLPADKDQNDLELAIGAALEMDPTIIWIIAALGNRIDQTLVNIFLLTREDLIGIDTHLIDGKRDVFLIRNEVALQGETGQRVSLIPLNGPVEGIRTEGLQFPLNNETLFPDMTRGVSNRLTEVPAKISIEDGLLLCVHELTNP
jgi:thiamine pyrophosphokinase